MMTMTMMMITMTLMISMSIPISINVQPSGITALTSLKPTITKTMIMTMTKMIMMII